MNRTAVRVFPDRAEVATGSGCSFGMFGCSFVLVGVFTIVFVLVSAEHIEHHSILERLVAVLLGLAFLVGGLLFSFGKNVITIDKSNGVIRKWNGLFSFRYATGSYPLDHFNRFAIEQTGPREYAVVVEGATTKVSLLTTRSYEMAREQSEKIGAYLPLDCQDEVPKGDLVV